MKKQSLFFDSRNCLNRDRFTFSLYCSTNILGDIRSRTRSGSQLSWDFNQSTSLDVCSFLCFCKPLGTKNRVGTSLYLLSPPLNCWLCHSDFQSSSSLSRNSDHRSKHCDLQCTAPKYDPGKSASKD